MTDLRKLAEALADLRAAVELADMRTDDGEVNPDGTVSEYILSATDWNRVVSIARGSKSEADERAIAPFRAALARPTPALDVEALALALHRWNNHTEWHTDFRGCVRCTPDAANIAREYAVITAYEALAARATEGGTDR